MSLNVVKAEDYWPEEKDIFKLEGRNCFTKSIGKKSYRFCCEFSEVVDAHMKRIILRCSYKVPSEAQFISHKCNFSLILPSTFHIPDKCCVQKSCIDITKEAATVAIDLNISISAMVGKTMHDFVNSIFQKGFQYGQQTTKKHDKSLPEISFSRRLIRDSINKTAAQYAAETKVSLGKWLFYSCTFDAGTVNTRQALYYCAASPGEAIWHRFLGTKTMEKPWCWNDYHKWAEDIVNTNPKLVGFVGDGLYAAIKGIADYEPGGVCRRTMGVKLIFSPCHNHIINNAFEAAIAASDDIKIVVNDARKLVVLLSKKNVKGTKLTVPHIPETRWLYAYDVVKLVLRREIEINAILASKEPKIISKLNKPEFSKFKNGIPPLFAKFCNAVQPIKDFQLAIERDSVSMADVYPLLMKTIVSYKSIISESTDDITKNMAKTIKNTLINAFREKARIALLIASFALTPRGILYINGKQIEDLFASKMRNSYDFDMFDNNDVDSEEDDSDIEDVVEVIRNSRAEQENEEHTNDSTDQHTAINDEIIDGYNTETLRTFRSIHATLHTSIHRFDDVSYNKDRVDLIYSPEEIRDITIKVLTKRFLIKYAQNHTCGTQEEKEELNSIVNECKMKLEEFFDNSERFRDKFGDICSTMDGTYGFSFWKKHINNKEDFVMHWIAKQALSFIAMASGESDCERAISRARYISDPRRGREKDDLTVARIIVGITSSMNRERRKRNLETINDE